MHPCGQLAQSLAMTRSNDKKAKKAACVERLERIARGDDKVCCNDDNEDDKQEKAVVSFREEALQEKCGVFGCISNGDWPTSLDVAHIICLGLVGLQHR